MDIHVHDDAAALGAAAGREAAAALRAAVAAKGGASYVVATGASQFATLATLVAERVPWERVTIFHLDEYAGLGADHPASFRRYLRERLLERLPRPPAAFHGIDAGLDPAAECRRLAALVPAGDFDVATIGIGENGHLAFNDPPADFETRIPYLVVRLDEACRRQQVGEGWFAGLADVPTEAVSMSVRRILATERIICSVPDARKAAAVRGAVAGPLTPDCPASILRTHPACALHLDRAAAAGLPGAAAGG